MRAVDSYRLGMRNATAVLTTRPHKAALKMVRRRSQPISTRRIHGRRPTDSISLSLETIWLVEIMIVDLEASDFRCDGERRHELCGRQQVSPEN